MTELQKAWVLPAAALLLTACNEVGPVAPDDPASAGAVEYLSCEVGIRSGDITCGGSEPGLGDGALGTIIAGQGVYVQLTSKNVSYDESSEIFSAEVSIRNLGNQVIGTSDGAKPDPQGIQIFFVDQPATTAGTGAVEVRNGDGAENFTANSQPYFRYSQALAPGRTSLPRIWQWSVPPTVEKFTFLVGVAAEIADEETFQPGGIDFISQTIASDSMHTCAIDYSGQAWCWGAGGGGRLGNGSTDDQFLPVPVSQGSVRFVSIAAGQESTCALADNGDAYCWGGGLYGRLGYGDTVAKSEPVKVKGDLKFRQISAGRQFNCGLTVDGLVYCWGSNSGGQYGNGTTTNSSEPVLSAGGQTFVQIAVGSFHACGIGTDGV